MGNHSRHDEGRVGWLKRGLAAQGIHALVEDDLGQAREDGIVGKVKAWVHTVEELNGSYRWAKGQVKVRTYEKPIGHWRWKLANVFLAMVHELESSLIWTRNNDFRGCCRTQSIMGLCT